ncbi:lipoprotein insertase outer membrane protein LolB [Alteromonas antoniana]|uniref:lipoprotein insertase outer membrane protein LolB n=1 Tax=Alteromonas antoniana TaxID=2803813 RepID=UPI001C43E7CC
MLVNLCSYKGHRILDIRPQLFMLLRFLFLFIISSLMLGCATRPEGPKGNVDLPAQVEKLRSITSWNIKGKMALRENGEAVSATLRWSVDNDALAFRLTNFLGVTLVDMQSNGLQATLEADGETYTDTDPSRLIYRVTGWDIPLDKLLNWVKGVPGERDTYTLTENGLLDTLMPNCFRCRQWQVQYGAYQNVDGVWLPGALTLNQKDTQNFIKIRINTWQTQ